MKNEGKKEEQANDRKKFEEQGDFAYSQIKLAKLYEKKENLKMAEHYYLDAFSNCILEAHLSFGIFYYQQEKYGISEKYFRLVAAAYDLKEV